jgi:hypothetical protein
MHRGNWRSNVAAAGWLIVGLIGPIDRCSAQIRDGSGVTAPVVSPGQAVDNNNIAERFSVPIWTFEDPREAERTRAREQKSDQHDAADLQAQRDAADAGLRSAVAAEQQFWLTVAQVVFAALGTVLILISLMQTREALVETRRSVKLTGEMGRDQSRAYVQAEKATVVFDGSRRFHIEIDALNSGTTPCKWFGYRCHPVSGDVSSAVKFSREHFKNKDITRWNGLANGRALSFSIADEDVSEAIDLANKNLSGFRIDGVIEYETYFGEVFETEFSFFIRAVTDLLLFGGIDDRDKRPGFKLSRLTRILNSYRKISG